jgi:hypothetical protein
MAGQIALDGFTRALTRVFGESFERAEGFFLDRGTSLFETLETVSAHEASRPVSAGCPPIAAQVDHICFFLDLTRRMARGENPGRPDWSASCQRKGVTDEEWSALNARLRDEYAQLLALARDPATWGDENAIHGALTLVAHVAFHLGQIREALCVVQGR